MGASIASSLHSLGYENVEDLVGEDAEVMYQKLMGRTGGHVDRCVLYVFRCALYYAANPDPEPEKLKWWNWMDDK